MALSPNFYALVHAKYHPLRPDWSSIYGLRTKGYFSLDAQPMANIIKAGRVWVPESSVRKGYVKDWAEGMVSQICSFPEGTVHDEFVDCISQGLRYLRDAGWISIDFSRRDEVEEEDITDAEIFNIRCRESPYGA